MGKEGTKKPPMDGGFFILYHGSFSNFNIVYKDVCYLIQKQCCSTYCQTSD